MTEEDWMSSPHPMPMLEYLQGKASDRKLRLFACACCRHRSVNRLLKERSNALIEMCETFADNGDNWAQLVEVANHAPRGRVSGGSWRSMNPVRLPPSSQAERAVLALAVEDAWEAAWRTIREAMNLLGSTAGELLRDIFGNPFSPVAMDPSWLDWMDGTVAKIAQSIYTDPVAAGTGIRYDPSILRPAHPQQENRFNSQHLPVLGDALQEAGTRGGCWVVDLVLAAK